MKNVLLLSIVLWTIILPTFADLTPQDLDKIRSILKEEIDPIKAEIKALDTRLQKVEEGRAEPWLEQKDSFPIHMDISWIRGKLEGVDKRFDSVDKQFDGVDKQFDGVDKQFDGVDKQFDGVDKQFDGVKDQISHATNVTYGLIALIVLAVGIPQILIAWRGRSDREQERRIEELAREIETLKQQRIVNP